MGGGVMPEHRVTRYQAHRGAVISRHDSELVRRAGLLELGVIRDDLKEIFRVERQRRRLFDLAADPEELINLSPRKDEEVSEGLQAWMRDVYGGLSSFDDSPPDPLDPESVEQLRSLGYVD